MSRNGYEAHVSESGHSGSLWITQGTRLLGGFQRALKTVMRENASIKSLLIITALALISVASGLPVQAQEPQVIAHIPFAFRVGTSNLPAGDYELKRQDESANVWLIENEEANAAVFAPALTEETNEEWDTAKLVFHQYGDDYFLSEIWYPGETNTLPVSTAERALTKEARNNLRVESLSILASLR